MENKQIFTKYTKLFLEKNSQINLISKNDEKYLWEKHISDSLSLGLFFEKYALPKTLLDIGTGGGFPAVPIAIKYQNIEVWALDSISKKIKAVEYFKDELNLKNLHPICSRVENFDAKFDTVVSRAVSSLKNICEYAFPKLKKGGYFVAFKSKKAKEEIEEAKTTIKKYKAEVIDLIEYKLPIDEEITRNLIVIKMT